MRLPSLLVTPQEARNASGKITPVLSGLGERSGSGWRLTKGLDEASVLATPNGVYVRGSRIEPQVIGAGPTVVTGRLTIPAPSSIGSLFIRYRENGVTTTTEALIPGTFGETGIVRREGTNLVLTTTGEIEVLGVLGMSAPEPWDREAILGGRVPWTWAAFAARTSPAQGRPTGVIRQRPTALVTINGIPTPVDSFTTRHGVDQPIGTASLTIPVSGDAGHITLNAPIEIQAGYRDRPTQRIFAGTIAEVSRELDADGRTIRIQAEDYMAYLRWVLEDDVTYPPRTTLAGIFRSFAMLRRLPLWQADLMRSWDDAYEIRLGGVPEIEDGKVLIKAGTSPLTWLTGKVALFGYRIFGQPRGVARLQRVSGLPPMLSVAQFVEGVDLFRVGTARAKREIVTNWTVRGASYTDKDGVPVVVRSLPRAVPPNPIVTPPGYVSGSESDSDLVTQQLVDAVRAVREIDHSEAGGTVTWETWGRPELQPGDAVSITAPGVAVPERVRRWLMRVEHHWSARGFTTTIEGWAGAGRALPSAVDETVIPIGTGVHRLGDEYLSHYVIPAPAGRSQVVIPFRVPGTYSSLALRGRQHGTNSYLSDGANTEVTVSQLEVWQDGEKVGSAQLPVSPENLSAAHDYRDDRYWESFRLPVPGDLEPGWAELRIIAGELPGGGGLDDFEIKGLEIEARGTGRAILPGART